MAEPALTFETELMIDQPNNCGYPQSFTVIDLPIWVSHDDNARQFIIPQTNDQALVGVYSVTIQGSISVPDDYTMASLTSYAAS